MDIELGILENDKLSASARDLTHSCWFTPSMVLIRDVSIASHFLCGHKETRR